MTDISVIGLGAMGSALARALLKGRLVTVWNRTASRMQPLMALGANGAATIADAMQASPSVIICIDNYAATIRLLGANEVSQHLSGRTLIQLSTGTPRDARECEIWAHERGARYIDGALLCGPASIGTERAMILVAGSKPAFASCESAIRSLGGDIRYLGDSIGAAAALDLAWLCQRFGLFLGVAHGARLCESENVDMDLYASMFAEGDRARMFAQVIHANAYEHPSATLATWYAALQRVQRQAHDAGINCEIPDFTAGLFQRAIAMGHAEEDAAALIMVLRKSVGA